MLKLSCYITGEDYKILKSETPESRKKVNALASIIFIPVIIWFFSAYLMVEQVLMGTKVNAIIVALIFSFLIFLIERNIVMARSNKSIRNFRYSLGIIIALLGAICIDEVVFKEDIDQKMMELKHESIISGISKLEQSYDERLQQAQSEVERKHVLWYDAMNDAKREADGTGGSGVKGVHAIAQLKLSTANNYQVDYEKALNKLEDLENTIENERRQFENEIVENSSNEALLLRIKALYRLVFSDIAMAIVFIFFTAFMFCMEFMVVFMKNNFPKTNYERKVELIEELGRKRIEALKNNDISNYHITDVDSPYKKAKELMNATSLSLH